MRRRLVLVIGLLVTLGLMTGTALAQNGWGDIPPHGHVMLIGFEIVDFDPETGAFTVEFDRCVELAGGRVLSTPAHHHSVHTGRAGEALFEAGNAVVPLAPLTPFESCDDFESPMTVTPPPEE